MGGYQARIRRAQAGMRRLWSLLGEIAGEAAKDRITMLGAALAYSAVFSLGPLLFLVIHVAGLVYGVQLAEREALDQVREYAGPRVSGTLQALLHATNRPGSGAVATWVGGATLLAGATGMFVLLHDALDLVFGAVSVPSEHRFAWLLQAAEKYLLAVAGIVVVGLLLLASIVAETLLERFHDPLDLVLPGGIGLWTTLNAVVPLGVIAVALGLMLRYVPNAVVAWRHAWLGAATTTLLFALGRFALGVYLARSNVGALYGAVGSLVALLVWIYYSAVCLFLGAEVAKVAARSGGPP